MNIARDYANKVDLKLTGWRVLRIWECDIKTKAKREKTLEKLYLEIIGEKENLNYYDSPTINTSIAAEPTSELTYGNNNI